MIPLKSKYDNKKKIYGFDVETIEKDNERYPYHVFYMGSVVGDDVKKVFFDKENMADYLISNKFNRSYMMATNLGYDFFKIFDDTEYIKDFKFIFKNDLLMARYKNITFVDTLNYTQSSVKKIGDMLGIDKLPQPKAWKREANNNKEMEELIKYNLRDSLISQRFGVYFQDFCNFLGCKMKLTIASTGLDNWRRHFQTSPLIQEPEFMLRKHYNAFHGGRTEIFKRGYIDHAYYYDFNSHYPACCFEGIDGKGSYPFPNSAQYINKNITNITYIEEREGISKVSVTTPNDYIMILGIKENGKFIFPSGTFTGWFTHVEIREALKHGYTINNILETIYYSKTFIPFRDVITDLYKLRRKYQIDDNKLMEHMIKILMNGGLYGKFAQKVFNQQDMYTIDKLRAEDNGKIYIKGEKGYIKDYIQRGKYIFVKKEIDKLYPFVHPILATTTTALARLKLFKYMRKVEDDTIYCDTDSIVTKRKRFSSSTELGGLKLEHEIHNSVFVRPKFYLIRNKDDKVIIKNKGVGKAIKNEFDFFNVLCNKKVNMERFTKLKESHVRKVPISTIIKYIKKLNLNDDKRIWDGSFNHKIEQDSKPLLIQITK